MNDFEEAIGELDLRLFEKIPSQSSAQDKQSFLACQLATREIRPNYNYLEIGSYLGGSIQPYLLDDRCARIYSIDKRPLTVPDERGSDFTYLNNSTKRMIENLRELAPEKVEKIVTIDGDTRTIDPSEIKDKIELCFVDGEHTDAAVLSDFKFCLKVLEKDGAIVFHDAQITYNGIAECIKLLQERSVVFKAYVLPHIVFVVEIGDFPLYKHARIMERLVNNHESYLFSLQGNDSYRQFANKLPFRAVRNLYYRIRKANISS